MKKWLLLVFSLLMLMKTSANAMHTSDTISVKEVEVKTFKYYIVNTADDFDSASLSYVNAQTLSRFLQENSSLQFKTYGTSGSSVMSIRGANPSQSKVIWNGLNIGSPMLNMNDMSLLGVSNTNEINLTKGGSITKNGNNALAGIIGLSNTPLYNTNSLSLSLNHSNLNNTDFQFKINTGDKYFSSQTTISLLKNNNNFSYRNRSEIGNPLQEQLNSEWNQIAILQSIFYRKNKHQIQWHQWFQESDRDLSPAVYNRTRRNYQLDKSYRTIANYSYQLNYRNKLNSNIGFTREQLRYVSRLYMNNQNFVLFNTRSYFDQLQYQLNWSYSKFNTNLTDNRFNQDVTFQYIFDGAYVEDYFQYRKRNKYSLSSTTRYSFYGLISTIFSNRIELVNSNVYYASSIFFNVLKFIEKGLVPYVKLAKNFNLPGLNDMYWMPGGNPNLSAEKSWEQELGLNYRKEFKKMELKTSIDVYHSLVSDWILWQPSAIENGLWSPQNLVEVKLQGIEFDQEFNYKINLNNTIYTKIFYAYTQAINNKPVNANDLSVGKQLIYVPLEKMGFNIAYQYKTYRLNANFHRVSHRYTTADHSEFLPAYQLIDLRVQKRVEFKTSNILAGLYIDNILNQSYESIPFQAMPARVFGGSITYQFIKQKTKK